jgi:hypothetical protein
MLSIEELRAVDPELKDFSDEEIEKIRDSLYPIIESILDRYPKEIETN